MPDRPGPENGSCVDERLPTPLDWREVFARDSDHRWLVEDLWPEGRQLHLFAARKSGKSLFMLWVAGCLAVGRCPFSGVERKPRTVVYLDYEMTADDVRERAEEMGFDAAQLAGRLCYYLLPSLDPLDTDAGGQALLDLVQRDGADVVILDTLSRAVEGKEDSNDTIRELYRHTGNRLKQAGVSVARLDHEGHQPGRSRGASAKADDVDVVWQIKKTQGRFAVVNKASRISWVPSRIDLDMSQDPLMFARASDRWPPGTKEKADELDQIKLPIDISKRDAMKAMQAAGRVPGRSEVLCKAIEYRRVCAASTSHADSSSGNQSGTVHHAI